MKNKIVVILVLFLILAGIGVGYIFFIRQTEPSLPAVEIKPAAEERTAFEFSTSASEIDWDDREVFKSGLVESSQSVLDELPLASTYYISLEIPDDLVSGLLGHQIVRYFNAEEIPLDQVYFRLFPNAQGGSLEVRDVMVDDELAEITLESFNPLMEENPLPTALRVDLSEPLQPGEAAVIEMDFILDIPTEMGGNYGIFGYFDDVMVLDTFYPMIPAYDQDDGWYSAFPQPNGDYSYNDASFYLVQVTAPADLLIGSAGVRVDHQIEGESQVATFAVGPARDYYLACSRVYTELEDQVNDDLTIRVLTRKEHDLHQQLALEFARDAIEIFSQRLGDYPYTEFEIVTAPMLALGVEYPGITFLRLEMFIENHEMYERPNVYQLEPTTVHEVAHMWFYNTVGNDQQNEPWLDEAVVQYLTYIYFLDKYGNGDGFVDSWYGRWSRVDYDEIPIGMPAGKYIDPETEVNSYGAIVYGRGPLFFLELEGVLGLDTLMSAIQNYYQDHLWEEGQPEDLREALEAACECDLTSYFEEWVYE
jgi:hypothetical protein